MLEENLRGTEGEKKGEEGSKMGHGPPPSHRQDWNCCWQRKASRGWQERVIEGQEGPRGRSASKGFKQKQSHEEFWVYEAISLGCKKKIIHCRINMSMLADGAGGGSLAKHTGGASKINWEQRGRRAATCAPSKSKKTPAKQTFSPPSSS